MTRRILAGLGIWLLWTVASLVGGVLAGAVLLPEFLVVVFGLVVGLPQALVWGFYRRYFLRGVVLFWVAATFFGATLAWVGAVLVFPSRLPAPLSTGVVVWAGIGVAQFLALLIICSSAGRAERGRMWLSACAWLPFAIPGGVVAATFTNKHLTDTQGSLPADTQVLVYEAGIVLTEWAIAGAVYGALTGIVFAAILGAVRREGEEDEVEQAAERSP